MTGPAAEASAECDADNVSEDKAGDVAPIATAEAAMHLAEANSRQRYGDDGVSSVAARAGRIYCCLGGSSPM